MTNFKERFLKNLEAEMSEFKNKILALSPQQIYDECAKIHFYEFIYDWLKEEDLTTKEYIYLTSSTKHILANLWNKSLKWDNFSLDLLDATLLLDDYLDGFLAHPNELEM